MCSRCVRRTKDSHCGGERLNLGVTSHMSAFLYVTLCLLVGTSQSLPTRLQHASISDSESLSSIVRDLEDAMFRLKDYALRVDYELRKATSSSNGNDIEDPSAEVNENDQRYMDDIYPELVAKLNDKKSAEDISNRTSLVSQQQQPAQKAGVDVGSPIADSRQEISSVQSQNLVSTSGELPVDDISLREALEFLVNLAKQKKQEKRDHDIPFPLAPDH